MEKLSVNILRKLYDSIIILTKPSNATEPQADVKLPYIVVALKALQKR